MQALQPLPLDRRAVDCKVTGLMTRTDRAARIAAALATVTCILWNAQAPAWFGVAYLTEQFLALILGLSLCALFLSARVSGQRDDTAPWWDILLACLALAACLYLVFWFPYVLDQLAYRSIYLVVLGGALVILVLEGVRRETGWMLYGIVWLFILYALVGHLVPGELTGRDISVEMLAQYLGLDPSAGFGVPMRVGASIVVLFVFFGTLLFKAGGGEFFTDLAFALTGRTRGGPAKIAIVGSALFGSISGSAVSNVVTTGTITIPMMQRSGYTSAQAGGIEAVASTGGQLMPPVMGAAAFLMAEFLEVSYPEIMAAALLPALLYYLSVFVQADLIAARDNIRNVDGELPRVSTVLRDGWHLIVPFVVLIGAFVFANIEPERAALYSAVTIIVAGSLRSYKNYRLTVRSLFDSLWQTGFATMGLIAIVASAGYVIGVLNLSGLGFGLTLVIVKAAGHNLVLMLFIAAAVCIVLGMGMPTTGVYLLLAAMIAPALIEAGVGRMAAHMFIFYFGMMSMITPPIALAAFAAASITGTSAMATGFMAMRFGWVAYVIPFLFIYEPEILMDGSWLAIASSTFRAAACTVIISVALIGYLRTRLRLFERVFAVLGGIVLFASFITHEYVVLLSAVGLALTAVPVITQFAAPVLAKSRQRQAAL
ncbi:MAG: TRAP transporter fused permease subunit [Pseudolabrys sp.]|nr:TRAP transporter fused permease subunit [Pseudolabrys sp.]